MVENVLINGICSGSVIHPGLFEIMFTSFTLPVAQRQSRLPIPLVIFKESTSGEITDSDDAWEISYLRGMPMGARFSSVTALKMLLINTFNKFHSFNRKKHFFHFETRSHIWFWGSNIATRKATGKVNEAKSDMIKLQHDSDKCK